MLSNLRKALLLTGSLLLAMLMHINIASAQLPPGGETFEVTLEYNCCGDIEIDYINFEVNPGSQSIRASADGSTTIQAEQLPFTIELSPDNGFTSALQVTDDQYGACFISSETDNGDSVVYNIEAGAACTLTATFSENNPQPTSYVVTPSAGSGGSISPSSPQTVEEGSSTTFTVTPNSGYEIDTVGGTCGGTLSGSTYTTAAVTQDCTVSATFAGLPPVTFTVTPSVGSGGSISPSSPQTVEESTTTVFTVTPNTGYEIDTVGGTCGGTLSGSTYTTAAVTQDCRVSATFAELPSVTFTVTPSVGTGGSISPSSPQTVEEGSTTSFTVIPNSGYQVIEPISGTCGGALSANTFTTAAVSKDCSVVASFDLVNGESDSDNDGIVDDLDICPETASDAVVDERGCSNADYRARDKTALIALYNATNGDGWTSNSLWLSEIDHCDWYGVRCAGAEGFVTQLSLNNNQLTGSIPAELGNLASLQSLVLTSNQLTGSIPAELGNFSSLQFLQLFSNQLTGSIPAELGNLSSLAFLDLYDNQLTGSIPAELANLSSLQDLHLADNQLTGSIPAELGNLASLNTLILLGNQLTGSIPAELGNLSSLQTLWLFSNQLTGNIPAELANLSSLQTLNLANNQLTGSIPAELGKLASLWSLSLASNQLTGSIPAELGNLSSLRSLRLGVNQLTGSIPAELDNLSSLQSLLLYSNQLTGSIPAELGNLSSLGYLWLFSNQLTGSIPAELGNLASLQELDFAYNELTGNIPEELGNLAFLEELDLAGNALTGTIPAELGGLASLQLLYLHNNQLTGSIPAELGNLASLERLFLESNQLTGSIPAELGNLASLERLFLENNQLTGSIPAELGDLASLEILNLALNQLTGSIPVELGNLASLEMLYLSHNQLTGSIPAELGNLADLPFLYLSHNQLTGSIPAELGNLVSLEELELNSNQLVGSIPGELSNLASLRYLYLRDNQLTGTIPAELINLAALQDLYLNNNQLSGVISESLGDYIAGLSLYDLTSNEFACPYPTALEQYFTAAGESCVLAESVPSAVVIEQFDYADGTITLTVSASDGGSSITSYDAICTDGTNSVRSSSTTNQIEVTGLTNDVAYTCTVTATNTVGTSEPSFPTDPITLEALPTGLPIWLLIEAAESAARQSGAL